MDYLNVSEHDCYCGHYFGNAAHGFADVIESSNHHNHQIYCHNNADVGTKRTMNHWFNDCRDDCYHIAPHGSPAV